MTAWCTKGMSAALRAKGLNVIKAWEAREGGRKEGSNEGQQKNQNQLKFNVSSSQMRRIWISS
jgi:hypothetical protein